MLEWNELHPYNAVHVVRIAAALDLERLKGGIQETLKSRGLTGLSSIQLAEATSHFGGSVECDLKLIEGGDPERSAFRTEIERQLNAPFPCGECFNPFRFFVEREHGAFSLGLVYFHPVADAESVVALLKEIVAAYRGDASPKPAAPIDLYPRRLDRRAFRHPAALVRQVAALPSFIRITRTSCRPRYRELEDTRNGFTFFSLDSVALGSLLATGKSWKVTVNDLFLAILLKSLAPLASARRQARRRKIAAGCIVNVRKELGVARGTFGLFLGSFLVAHEITEDGGLKELAIAIRAQTAQVKASQLFLGTPMQLAFASLMLRFFSTRGKRSFYQKHCPLWGGITNMNLNTLWHEPAQSSSLDYWRAVSTGPVTPLVFSVTTVGDRVNIGLSYRSTVFTPEEIGQVQRRFLEEVAQLEGKG